MTNADWEVIKEFYKTEFGIDGWVVEVYANLDILSLCVSGASNDSIVTFLELPIAEVVKVLGEVLDFDGWRSDLSLNPYRLFMQFDGLKGSVEHFTSFIKDVTVELRGEGNIQGTKIEKLFYMCEIYNDIEERIQNEWI